MDSTTQIGEEMSRHPRGGQAGRRRRALWTACAVASTILVSASVSARAAWASGEGYGPGGGGGGGGGEGFGPVIVAETVGPDGGNVVGRYHDTTVDVVVPPGELTTKQIVEVTPISSECDSLKGLHQQVVIGFAVFHVPDDHAAEPLNGEASVTLGNEDINSDTMVFGVVHDRCVPFQALALEDGQLTVSLETYSAFLIASPAHNEGHGNEGHGNEGKGEDQGHGGQGQCQSSDNKACAPPTGSEHTAIVSTSSTGRSTSVARSWAWIGSWWGRSFL